MSPSLRHAVIAALLAVPFAWASAQPYKAGLWESKSRMSGSPEMEQVMAEAQKAMASLPPEQRKQMEAMMAKQGMSMGLGKDGETTARACVTKEMAERKGPPAADQSCTYHSSKIDGNKQTFGFTCPGRSGEGVVTMRSDTEFHTVMNMKAVGGGGKVMTMKAEGTSRFLGADCGDVKPLQMPKQ